MNAPEYISRLRDFAKLADLVNNEPAAVALRHAANTFEREFEEYLDQMADYEEQRLAAQREGYCVDPMDPEDAPF